jgi:acid phosphatase type 7
MRSRVAKYTACVVLSCAAAVLMAVPIFAQTVTVTLVGAGDIAKCDAAYDEQTAQLIGNTLASLSTPAQVITLGDNAYLDGTRAQFANCYDNYRLSDYSIYDPSRPAWWGKYKDRTMPSLGNHEYRNSTDPSLQSKPYYDYFGAQNGFLQPAAPVPNEPQDPNQYGLTFGKGYYSYDLGSWHIVVLNSNCDFVSCDSTSVQADWLRNDLAAHPAQCTLAYMHHPLYATGTGGLEPRVKPLWQILYDKGADVMLTGHNHRYERLARIDPNDNPDSKYGIRPITAGTGGDPGSGTTATNEPNSEKKIFGTAGILRMDLSDTSYTWQFIAVDGKVLDSSDDVYGPGGSEPCHGAPGSADTTAPTVTNVAPANGATEVVVATNVEATFSEAMDPSTISDANGASTTFTLLKQGSTTPVAAHVSYDSATNKATLNPDAGLEAGVTYTATVKGGTGGVEDLAGNALAADKTWSFTTQAAVLSAPSNLSAERSGPLSKQRIDLSWTDNSNSEAGFVIERSVDKVAWSVLTSQPLAANTTSYRDTALQRNTTYYYRVFAVDSTGTRSDPSNVASATTK